MKKPYNTTQLDPDKSFERHVYHRDQFAHYLRWTHVLKIARIGQKTLDFGSGSGSLAEVFYRNRFKQSKYIGLEYREKTVNQANEKFKDVDWIEFFQCDIIKDDLSKYKNDWDFIVSFEVAEHIGKNNVDKYLSQAKSLMTNKTKFLISTPNYDEKVGAAGNHTYDSGDGRGKAVQEFYHDELQSAVLDHGFIISDKFGTFASQTHYKKIMNEWQSEMFKELNKYYDSNLMSILMAPMFPEQSRNCLWILEKKND